MKGTMKIMIPLLVANLGLIIGVVALIVTYVVFTAGG